jgi:hypothetical protein
MLFPMQLQKIYTTSEIGIIVGSITFFKFLSLYIFGKFSFSRKSIFILNNLFILSIILIYIFQNSFYLLLLFSTIFGVINNFIISYFDQIKINTYRKYLGLFKIKIDFLEKENFPNMYRDKNLKKVILPTIIPISEVVYIF